MWPRPDHVAPAPELEKWALCWGLQATDEGGCMASARGPALLGGPWQVHRS